MGRLGLLVGLFAIVACGQAEPDRTGLKTDPGAVPPSESITRDGASAPTGTPTSTPGGTPTPDARVRVLIIGTSLTAAYGLDYGGGYPSVLQRLADSSGFKVRIDPAGVSGETSAGARARIDWLLSQPSDVVIIETGANDGLRAIDPRSTRENIVAIIDAIRAKQPKAKVLIVAMEAPPNFGQRYTGEFRALFHEVAREKGATLIPFFLDGVAGVDSLNQADGIHPNVAGAAKAARNMWRTLERVLETVPGSR